MRARLLRLYRRRTTSALRCEPGSPHAPPQMVFLLFYTPLPRVSSNFCAAVQLLSFFFLNISPVIQASPPRRDDAADPGDHPSVCHCPFHPFFFFLPVSAVSAPCFRCFRPLDPLCFRCFCPLFPVFPPPQCFTISVLPRAFTLSLSHQEYPGSANDEQQQQRQNWHQP